LAVALSPEERALLGRAIKRDREAFAQLYVQYHEPVLRRVQQIIRQRDEAEDIAGETFLRAWNAVDRFKDRDVSILAWLCRIAENRAFEHLKKRRPTLELDESFHLAALEETPEEVAIRRSEAADVKEAMIQLPHLQREVLSQRFYDGMDYNQVADSLGKPIGTIRVIQHRALAALKSILTQDKPARRTRPSPGALK
jgi:RNA polymerase sigma-70 factor (ECF subfamily)